MADAEALRPAFEAWISASPFERDVRRIPNDEKRHAWPGQYRDIDVQLAWLAFERGVTAGVKGQPLTDEQIIAATDEIGTGGGAFLRVARAIEKAHGIVGVGVAHGQTVSPSDADGKGHADQA